MPTGTGLAKFQAAFPDRFIDVGIAEQHAVTLATGLALGGMRPVVALYSTFLQRAFDQTVHDVCQNDAPGAARGGPRGPRRRGRHQPPGHVHDPRPAAAAEPRHRQPEGRAGAALAAPDGVRPGPPVRAALPARRRLRRAGARRRRSSRSGRGEVLREGRDLLFVGFGPITTRALEVADVLEARRLVRRRHQRPVRQAARPPADPRPGARQAARRDVRGERGHRRVRVRRPRGVRGGPPGRSRLPRRRRSGSSASPATGSWTTAP